MHSTLSTAELEDTMFKARAAVAALELMERELGTIAKAGVLRSSSAQIREIRKAIRTLISSLERTANQSAVELEQRELAGRE